MLSKVEQIIREEMAAIGGLEVRLPALHPRAIWETTGRWGADFLYKISSKADQEPDLTLGPTHEEVVTPLLKAFAPSYKDLPRAVFQIQTKFRKEARPKSGLLRGREFGMKDMYSFHTSETELEVFYESARQAYDRIFARVGLGAVTFYTFASGGLFSEFSHEFQAVTPYGEDTIYIDDEKGIALNDEIIDKQTLYSPEQRSQLREARAIEVGNIFKLGTRFSTAFNFQVHGPQGSPLPVHMGCYGIGTSRLVGTVAEILSNDDELRWPLELAPYQVHVTPLGRSESVANRALDIARELDARGVEVVLDDRDVSPGVKLKDSDLLGFPFQVIIGDRSLADGNVELRSRETGETQNVAAGSVVEMLAGEKGLAVVPASLRVTRPSTLMV